MGDIAARNILFQMTIEGIRGTHAVQNRAREDGLRENTGGVIDQFRVRVRCREGQPSREPLFQARRERVVSRVSYIISKQRNGSEPRIRTQQWLLSEGGTADRR